MTIVSGFVDAVPGGDAGTPKTGSLVAAITAGSTDCVAILQNTGDAPMNLYWRKTGTTPYYLLTINPQVSVEQWISLTAARTFEYYFDASTLQVDVAYFFGTGLTSTVSLSDVEAWLTMYGYTISASGDLTSAQVQLCLDRATSEVTMAATRYALIAMQILNADWKNIVVKDGAVAHALRALDNKGAARGLEQQTQRISPAMASQMIADYNTAILKIEAGIYYGA
jgi:hypothetical protein